MSLTAIEQPGRKTTLDLDGKLVGRRTFIVQSTTRLTGFEEVTGLPAIGDAWPSNSVVLCQAVDATESEQLDAGGWMWTIECEYRNFVDEEDGSNLGVAPLDRSAVWVWDSKSFIETRFKDLDGKPYLNPAGDPFNPPPQFDVAHVIATVKKNYSTFSGGFAIAYINSVNHASYAGGDRGTVKIDQISSQPKVQDGVTFHETTLILHYNPLGWNPYYELNQGPRYLDSDGKLTYSKDGYGVVSTEMSLLNADGTQAIQNPAVWGADFSDAPSYTDFRQHQYQNFTALNLL